MIASFGSCVTERDFGFHPRSAVDTMCHMRYSSSMATRTTVNISLTPELDTFLKSRVKSGQTTSEVVREALRLLQSQESERERAFRQLKAKLERGVEQSRRGELLDGEAVFAELQSAIASHRPPKKNALHS